MNGQLPCPSFSRLSLFYIYPVDSCWFLLMTFNNIRKCYISSWDFYHSCLYMFLYHDFLFFYPDYTCFVHMPVWLPIWLLHYSFCLYLLQTGHPIYLPLWWQYFWHWNILKERVYIDPISWPILISFVILGLLKVTMYMFEFAFLFNACLSKVYNPFWGLLHLV